MKRVALVASKVGYQTRSFDDAAQRMGVTLLMATDRCHVLDDPWGDRALPLRFDDPHAAARTVAAARPDAIIAVGDRPAWIAALAAEHAGIRWSPAHAVAAAIDKYAARRRFAAAGLPVPNWFRVPVDSEPAEAALRTPFPCVLKPLGLSASRGVIRANDPVEFTQAFLRIRALLAEPEIARLRAGRDQFIQVERFIPGREFAVEGIVTHGAVQIHAIFDKPDELNGPFFEETIYVTPSRECEPAQRLLRAAAAEAVHALGLSHGPFHAEFRVNDEGAWPLEVAPRPIGGICSRALRFTGGTSLEELILMHALGAPVSHLLLEDGATGVMMIPVPRAGIYRGAEGTQEARLVPHITGLEITAKEAHSLRPLPEGATYLGFLFARAPEPAAVEAALREAHRRLRFEITPELPLLDPDPAGGARQQGSRRRAA